MRLISQQLIENVLKIIVNDGLYICYNFFTISFLPFFTVYNVPFLAR